MHLRFEQLIYRSRDAIWALFDDPQGKQLWQPTLREAKLVKGNFGEVGAVTRLRYNETGPAAEMVETITAIEPPALFAATYDTPLALNRVTNRFLGVDEEQTRWVMECEFRLKGFAIAMTGFAVPMVEQRLRADMARFKAVAEGR